MGMGVRERAWPWRMGHGCWRTVTAVAGMSRLGLLRGANCNATCDTATCNAHSPLESMHPSCPSTPTQRSAALVYRHPTRPLLLLWC